MDVNPWRGQKSVQWKVGKLGVQWGAGDTAGSWGCSMEACTGHQLYVDLDLHHAAWHGLEPRAIEPAFFSLKKANNPPPTGRKS